MWINKRSFQDFEYFATWLNNLHPTITHAFEKTKFNPFPTLPCNEFSRHWGYAVETDIYYKDPNLQNYLPYISAHSKHCTSSLPDNLVKRFYFCF